MGYSVSLIDGHIDEPKMENIIKLPCKVGDLMHCLYHDSWDKQTHIRTMEVEFFEVHKDYIIIEGWLDGYCYRYFATEIGKSVFFDLDEAKTAFEKEVRYG